MKIGKNTIYKRLRIGALAFTALLVVGAVVMAVTNTTFAALIRVPAPKPNADAVLRIYVSPGATDTNDGLSPTRPIKTVEKANAIAQQKWDEGYARGDVEVRFAAATFPAVRERFKIWTFAPAKDKYVRFLPTWYTNDADANARPVTDYPLFSGASNLEEADAPFKVEPTQNKGGSYEFAYLRVENYNNGILLNGGVPTTDPDALDPSQVNRGVRRGLNAPIKNPIFRNLTFTNMGSKYAPGHGNSFGSVRPWNTVDALVQNVRFKNLDEDPITMSIHGVYGYHSYGTIVEDSTFDTVLADPIRYRDSGGWIIRNNKFIRAGFVSNVSQWYAHKVLDDTYVDTSGPNSRRFSECSGVQAVGTTANNQTDGLDYHGNNYYTSQGQRYPFYFQDIRTYEDPAVCNDPSRVYAPETTGHQTGEGRYRITWNPARTLSGGVARYHIYRGDANDNKGQLVTTVGAGIQSYEFTNLPAEQDLYYYVVAEGTAGGFSPRTDNRRWMNLVPYTDQEDTENPTVSIYSPNSGIKVDTSVTISATAGDNDSVTRVEFYQGTTKLGEDTTLPYTYTWDTRDVSNGSYTITARAYDPSNNQATSQPITIIVEHPVTPPPADNTNPSVNITSPANNTQVDASVNITANASDNVGVTRVEFYQGTTKLGESTSSPYSYSWNTSGVANGNYVITARAYDAAGNSATSQPVTIIVQHPVTPPADNTNPSVTITGPTNNTQVDASVNITANATDNVGVTRVEFYQGTTKLGEDTSAPYAYTWDTSGVPNGNYTITARAYDAAGNSTTSSAVTVIVQHPVVNPPQQPTTEVDFLQDPPVAGVHETLQNSRLNVQPGSVCGDISYASLVAPTTVTAPQGVDLLGGVAFTLDCTSNGGSTNVTLTMNNVAVDASRVRVYKSNGTNLDDITGDVSIVVDVGTLRVNYTLTDGGVLDEDGQANGAIRDPLYIGFAQVQGGNPDPGTPPASQNPHNDSLADTGVNVIALGVAGVSAVIGGAVAVRRVVIRR